MMQTHFPVQSFLYADEDDVMNAKLKFAFLASLLVNVFLVGVLLGELPRRFDEGVSREERMEKAIEALPEPLRARFRGENGPHARRQ